MFNTLTRMGASGAGAYEIERSARFYHTDGQILSRTAGTSTSQNKFTFSTWVKLCRAAEHDGSDMYGELINGHTADNDDGFGAIYFWGGALRFAGWNTNWRVTSRMFRDVSSWYHIVVAVDTTLGTADNRVKMYINGVEETSFSTSNNPGQNDTFGISNNSAAMQIGRDNAASSSRRFDGYMAETHFIDGQQLTASSFGETNGDTGQWVAKKYAGTYGNNGFYLNFSDNSGTTATTLGKDSSGNGNNFTPNNFSVAAGTGNDSLEDTPTNNFCTLNSLENGYGTTTYSNGNLEVAASNAWVPMRGSMAVTSGKWYWEVYGADGNTFIGVAKDNTDISTINPMLRDGVILYYGDSGNKRIDGTFTSYGSSYGTSNVIGVALDIDNGKLYFAEDNTWQNSGDPTSGSSGTGAINLSDSTGLVGSQIIPFFCKNGTQFQVNFGQRAFTHTPPTGYKTLCTANLPEPTILKGTDHFVTKTYSGTGSTQTITTELDADLVWVKRRDSANYHIFSDTVRGAGHYLVPNNSDASSDGGSQLINGFSSTGFQVGTENAVNNSSGTYVSWNWEESASAGFDIVTYTGTGSNTTVAHNLGVQPDLIIVKNRDQSDDWAVYHDSPGPGYVGELNNTGVFTNVDAVWNNTRPTSSVINIGDDHRTNANGEDYIAYIWSSVEGYSKVGSYVGNGGGADGVYVHLGFKPAFMLIKRNATESWIIVDNARDPDNPVAEYILADTDGAAASGVAYDFTASGVKFKGNSQNESGATYFYLAMAETPFKYANAR